MDSVAIDEVCNEVLSGVGLLWVLDEENWTIDEDSTIEVEADA